MAKYWVTFRIEHDAGYDDRYDGMLDAIYNASNGFWSEPTSFMFVESELEIDNFATVVSKPLNPETDLLVTRRLNKDSSRYFGNVAHLDVLKSFLPHIKKV
jgi:hypothetical protein